MTDQRVPCGRCRVPLSVPHDVRQQWRLLRHDACGTTLRFNGEGFVILSEHDILVWAYSKYGLTPSANKDELKRAWRTKLSANHPDKVVNMATEIRGLVDVRAKDLTQLYEALRTGDRKQLAAFTLHASEPGEPGGRAPDPARRSAGRDAERAADRAQRDRAARDAADAEARTQAEAQRAKDAASARARAEERTRAESARAEAEARAHAEATRRAHAERQARARAEAEIHREAEAQARAVAEAHARAQGPAQARLRGREDAIRMGFLIATVVLGLVIYRNCAELVDAYHRPALPQAIPPRRSSPAASSASPTPPVAHDEVVPWNPDLVAAPEPFLWGTTIEMSRAMCEGHGSRWRDVSPRRQLSKRRPAQIEGRQDLDFFSDEYSCSGESFDFPDRLDSVHLRFCDEMLCEVTLRFASPTVSTYASLKVALTSRYGPPTNLASNPLDTDCGMERGVMLQCLSGDTRSKWASEGWCPYANGQIGVLLSFFNSDGTRDTEIRYLSWTGADTLRARADEREARRTVRTNHL